MSIETTYQKMTQIEHIQKRPGMYIGQTKKINESTWIYKNDCIIKEDTSYSPGFLKIFDEILTNALDHSERNKGLTCIKINWDNEGLITIYNNGEGIPIVLHPVYKVYIPELIFGTLLSGSNYNDSEKRTGAGTNGLGSKLTCIFSKKFTVETVDSEQQLKFIQTFSDSMSVKSNVKITKNSGKSYTKISFLPDYSKFEMNCLDSNTIEILSKRIFDCIAITHKKVDVFLNDIKLKGKGLLDYTKYFNIDSKAISETQSQNNLEWEYIIFPSDSFKIVSFVNGTFTNQGGKHVDYLLNQIILKYKELIQTKKKIVVKNQTIKDHLFLFLVAKIVNPEFNSQTKEYLTNTVNSFGIKFQVSDAFIKKMYQSDITTKILEKSQVIENDMLSKTDGKKKSSISVEKLDDAIKAGTKESKECTLYLTEGNSAMSFAVSGFNVIGREYNGVFPLKGKLLNVSQATKKQLIENNEINNIKKILGLKMDQVYTSESIKTDLRYGKVVLLCDQDSVTGDTPILLSDLDGNIFINRICDIADNFIFDPNSGKEYGSSNYLVWSDSGWTKIKGVMKHLTKKKIYRVTTSIGSVDVTEDHSLLSEDGKKIKPTELNLNPLLLHSFPKIQYDYDDDNFILDNYYYELGLQSKFTNIIFNPNWNQRKSFFLGQLRTVSVSDDSTETDFTITVLDKLYSQLLYILGKSLNYRMTIKTSVNDFSIRFSTEIESLSRPDSYIQSVHLLPEKEQYVYDLETENHHFQAGIGEMIVHNTDGFHIAGLVFNFFHTFWPELLELNYIQTMQTPLIKCLVDSKPQQFYSEKEFNTTTGIKTKVKYYKGLGTSTALEAKECFKNLKNNLKIYNWSGSECKKALVTAFGKVNDRKEWLNSFLELTKNEIKDSDKTISSFINTELIYHSMYDNCRSIPHLIDGLKPSQRKVLYTVFKKNITSEIKVAQLGAIIANDSNYHHGEVSLFGTIIGMAQDYTGSNNMNVLEPCGQFGTRLGKDSASPRYIFTRMNDNTKKLFLKEDNCNELLETQIEETQEIEPIYFFPTLPLVLINGAVGIGTGYSTTIPCFNPKDLAENIRLLLNKKEPKKLIPWYRGFKGTITPFQNYFIMTCTPQIKKNLLIISEIPIGTFITDFKEFVKNKSPELEYKLKTDNSTENEVYLELEFSKITKDLDFFINFFKLSKKISLDNMNLFYKRKIIKYSDPNKILSVFLKERLLFTKNKKELIQKRISEKLIELENLKKFIEYVVDSKIIIYKKNKETIQKQMKEFNFMNCESLMKISIDSFTKNHIEELSNLISKQELKLNDIKLKTVSQFILEEMNQF